MNKEQILSKWKDRAKNIQDCHYDASATLKNLHYLTGLPLVVLSVVSASNLLAKAETIESFAPYFDLTAAILGVLVTVLAAIQTFLGFEKRSEIHYRAGAKYGSIKREIELCDPANVDDGKLSQIRQTWDALTEDTPIIPLRIWRMNEKKRESARQS